jgi:pyruvate formate lyase activating enzyme
MERPARLARQEALPRFFSDEDEGVIRCELCPRRCAIPKGRFGACGVRGSKNGKAIVPFYGFVSALAVDPVEKKPLYHFRPGSRILSIGFAGCNLRCPFCQNWHISQNTDIPGRRMKPGEVIAAALREDSAAIAYTYSEPLVHAEFLLDCMTLAHRHGIANALVTNGCANAAAAGEILALTDAANIDLKCFSAETYSEILGGGPENGTMETVLAFIALALKKGVHVELTTLVVPGLNDSEQELERCADFIAGLPETPWHLSAYHTDYRWNAPPTSGAFLRRAACRAREKLRYVYTGNIEDEANDTVCSRCGAVLVRRRGYRLDTTGLAPNAAGEQFFRCAACGERTPLVC